MNNAKNISFKIKVLEDKCDKRGFVPIAWNFLSVEEAHQLLLSSYILKVVVVNDNYEIIFRYKNAS